MERYPPSQDEVLGAFIKALNAERRASYAIVDRPDKTERNRPEVDYLLRDAARGPDIAAEVSSTWRSDGAGKEDADWTTWVDAVRARVRGSVPGEFLLSTPMRIPRELSADDFAAALVEILRRERPSLERLWRSGKGAYFTVCGIDVLLTYSREGSDISCGRLLSERDGREFPDHVSRLVAKKSEKIKRHKEAGRETWLVVYNTFWPAMKPSDVKAVVLAALGAEHGHIDHFGVVGGNPPDDAWLTTIR
jgi:hypothetical protein